MEKKMRSGLSALVEQISYEFFDGDFDDESEMLSALHELGWKLVNLTRPEGDKL
jgi:hypothetical protein|tara:strand:+ start:933 stop:1094 length:162 start_codon:yes stop_codon:yes gene_type:complete